MIDFPQLPDGSFLLPDDQLLTLTGALLADAEPDRYTIRLTAGQVIELLLVPEDPTSPPDDLSISIRGPQPLSWDGDDHEGTSYNVPGAQFDPDPQLVFTAPEAGDYLIEVYASPGSGYALKVDPDTPIKDPQPDNAFRGGFPVTIGETVTAEIHRLDDRDGFAFDLTEGDLVDIIVQGAGAIPLSSFIVFGEPGVASVLPGEEAVITLLAPRTSTYSLAVAPIAARLPDGTTVDAETGEYTFTVTPRAVPPEVEIAIKDAEILRLPTADDPVMTIAYTLQNLGNDTAHGARASVGFHGFDPDRPDEGFFFDQTGAPSIAPGASQRFEYDVTLAEFQFGLGPFGYALPESAGALLAAPYSVQVLAVWHQPIGPDAYSEPRSNAWVTIEETGGYDHISGVGPDRFVLMVDGGRDHLRGFEVGRDVMDVSAWGVTDFDGLVIEEQVRRDGSVNWVTVGAVGGPAEVAVRYAEGIALEAAALTADSFVFASEAPARAVVLDTEGFTDLRASVPSTYVMLDDDVRDFVRTFTPGVDQIDVSAFADSFEELEVTNQTRRDGSTNWVRIADAQGVVELAVRFSGGAPLDAGVLGAEDFVFG